IGAGRRVAADRQCIDAFSREVDEVAVGPTCDKHLAIWPLQLEREIGRLSCQNIELHLCARRRGEPVQVPLLYLVDRSVDWLIEGQVRNDGLWKTVGQNGSNHWPGKQGF